MTTDVIRVEALSKHFGKVRALDGLDLAVRDGEIFGFLGPNGAGKSTTIRILVDLIRPTAGSVAVLGHQPQRAGHELRARIGYLPGELRMPGHSTAGRYLSYLARLRHGRGIDQIEPLARRFDLDLSRPIGKLSKGNKQKIGLIQAFMHRPDLLILDDLKTLRSKAGQEVVLHFLEAVELEAFSALSGVGDVSVERDPVGPGSVVRCVLRGEPDQLLKLAARHHVIGWKAADRELEDMFLDFYRDTPDNAATEIDDPTLGSVVDDA